MICLMKCEMLTKSEMDEERWRGKEEDEAGEGGQISINTLETGEENKIEAISLYMPEKEICAR